MLADELDAHPVIARPNELVDRQRVPELAHVARVLRRHAVIADANHLVERRPCGDRRRRARGRTPRVTPWSLALISASIGSEP